MRMVRLVLPAFFVCCLVIATGSAFAAPATAPVPVVVHAASAPANVLPPDPFVNGAVTTSAAVVCTLCDPLKVDLCVGQPNHGDCLDHEPANCHCRKCNNVFDCWID